MYLRKISPSKLQVLIVSIYEFLKNVLRDFLTPSLEHSYGGGIIVIISLNLLPLSISAQKLY